MINMKLDFIIAGAAKSGSTSLIRYLDRSPDISCLATLSDGNEINFFSKDRIYKKGLKMRIIDRLRQINLKDVEKPPMKPETKRILMDYFKESNQKLGKLIGKDLSIWDSWI